MNNSWEHINAAGTYVIKPGHGILHAVCINTTASAIITVYDNASAASGRIIAVFKSAIVEGTYFFDIPVTEGITVVTAGASDITVVFT